MVWRQGLFGGPFLEVSRRTRCLLETVLIMLVMFYFGIKHTDSPTGTEAREPPTLDVRAFTCAFILCGDVCLVCALMWDQT